MADTLKCNCGGDLEYDTETHSALCCKICGETYLIDEIANRLVESETSLSALRLELEEKDRLLKVAVQQHDMWKKDCKENQEALTDLRNKRVDVVNPNDIVLIINQKLNEDLSFQGIVDVNETAIEIAKAIQTKLKAR